MSDSKMVLAWYETEKDFQQIKDANSDIKFNYGQWKTFSEAALREHRCKIFIVDPDTFLSFIKANKLMNISKVRAAYVASMGKIPKADFDKLVGLE